MVYASILELETSTSELQTSTLQPQSWVLLGCAISLRRRTRDAPEGAAKGDRLTQSTIFLN
ncbi:MAG: hypothetical protein HC773_26595 [Scytonema sp. CRU_2_7]|nr:hypothetical protein [Scytonema sp. CRU_2_7]